MIYKIEPFELFAIFSRIERNADELNWNYSKFIEIKRKIERESLSIQINSSLSAFQEILDIYSECIELSENILKPVKALNEIQRYTAPYYPAEDVSKAILKIFGERDNEKNS